MPGARQSHSHALKLHLALPVFAGNELLLDDWLGCAHYVFPTLQSLRLDELAVVVADHSCLAIGLTAHEVCFIEQTL